MASMTFSNVTSTSFTAEVTDLDTSYARDDRSVDWYLGSTQVSSSSLSAHASSASCSFSGLTPNTDYEMNGFTPNVVFPTSVLCDGATGRMAIYYGAADTYTALAFTTVDILVDYIKSHSKVKPE